MRQGEGQEDLAALMGVPPWQFTRSRMALRLALQKYINARFQSLRPEARVRVASNGSLGLGTSLYSSKAMQFLALLLVVCYKNPIMIRASPILSIGACPSDSDSAARLVVLRDEWSFETLMRLLSSR